MLYIYTCPTSTLQILELGACGIFYTHPTLILQILKLEACFTHVQAWSSKFWSLGHLVHLHMPTGAYCPLGHMPYLVPSRGTDSFFLGLPIPDNIATFINVNLLQGQHPYHGSGWVVPAHKPLLGRAASRPSTHPLCIEHCQVDPI